MRREEISDQDAKKGSNTADSADMDHSKERVTIRAPINSILPYVAILVDPCRWVHVQVVAASQASHRRHPPLLDRLAIIPGQYWPDQWDLVPRDPFLLWICNLCLSSVPETAVRLAAAGAALLAEVGRRFTKALAQMNSGGSVRRTS